MDSDLAWVNGKSSRQSWCYADAFQRSIISEAIYHFTPVKHLSDMRSQSNASYAWIKWCQRDIITLYVLLQQIFYFLLFWS